jgi:hypothetical protein
VSASGEGAYHVKSGSNKGKPPMVGAQLVERRATFSASYLSGSRYRDLAFVCCWFFIMSVSVMDSYLTIYYHDTMYEENPAGRLLLAQGGLSLFIAVKKLGTILVAGILIWLYHWYPNKAACVAGGVGLLQAALLLYLFT